MATTNAPEYANATAVPQQLNAPGLWYGKLRCFQATVPLAAQASGDSVNLFVLPAGFRPAFGMLTASASLGSATIAVGTADAAGRYRAAATFTAADAPTPFGRAEATADRLAEPETVRLTIGAAALPGSGSLIVRLFGTGAE